jgi:hypothetical protein
MFIHQDDGIMYTILWILHKKASQQQGQTSKPFKKVFLEIILL